MALFTKNNIFLKSLTAYKYEQFPNYTYGNEVGDMDMNVDDEMRQQLLAEEFKLRKKQPPAWTMQKYRKYANFGANRKKKAEEKQ